MYVQCIKCESLQYQLFINVMYNNIFITHIILVFKTNVLNS